MITVRVKGTSYEMGRRVGKAFPLAIWWTAANRIKGHHRGNCDIAALHQELDKRAAKLADVLPEAHEYLRGVSEGSTVPLRSLMMVNFGTDIVPQRSGCSIAGFQNTPRGPVIGGNLDDPSWHYLSFDSPAGGYKCIVVSLPAYFAKWGGMNEHGLCVTGSSGQTAAPEGRPVSDRDRFLQGPPRDLLYKCRNVDEALELLRDSEYARHNYMLCDCEKVVQIEDSGLRTFREPDDAPLCNGNLRRSESEAPGFSDVLPTLSDELQNHAARNAMLKAMMLNYAATPCVEALMEVLSSDGEAPDDIRLRRSACNIATSVSLVAVPRERRVYVGSGPVCVNGYTEYVLD